MERHARISAAIERLSKEILALKTKDQHTLLLAGCVQALELTHLKPGFPTLLTCRAFFYQALSKASDYLKEHQNILKTLAVIIFDGEVELRNISFEEVSKVTTVSFETPGNLEYLSNSLAEFGLKTALTCAPKTLLLMHDPGHSIKPVYGLKMRGTQITIIAEDFIFEITPPTV